MVLLEEKEMYFWWTIMRLFMGGDGKKGLVTILKKKNNPTEVNFGLVKRHNLCR